MLQLLRVDSTHNATFIGMPSSSVLEYIRTKTFFSNQYLLGLSDEFDAPAIATSISVSRARQVDAIYLVGCYVECIYQLQPHPEEMSM